MNRVLARLWPVMLAAAMVLLPSLGPMVDHHFAERQPYHAHVGMDVGHEHGYQDFHAHSSNQSPDGNPALYNFDTSSAGPAVALLTDSELVRHLMIEPGSVSDILGPADSIFASVYLPPPDRPPRSPLQAFVSI